MDTSENSGQHDRLPLVIRGEMGIQQADELHTALLRALEQAEWLEVDLGAAREVGLCCLQLLCAAHRSARKLGKRLTIGPGSSADFQEAVARAGYLGQRRCASEGETDCLWSMGGEQ
jgi:ABC-type transporter Mla MlaB component